MLIMSYAPLLTDYTPRSLDQDGVDDLCKAIDIATQAGQSHGCIWLSSESEVRPVLIFDKGDEIAAHVRSWSEGKPEDWFTFFALETDDDSYHLFLMPRIDKSIKRHGEQHNIDTFGEHKVIFVPLALRAKVSDFSRECLGKLPDKVTVGILDEEYTLFGDINKLNFEKIVHWFDFDLRSVYDKTLYTSLIPMLDGASIIRDYGAIEC